MHTNRTRTILLITAAALAVTGGLGVTAAANAAGTTHTTAAAAGGSMHAVPPKTTGAARHSETSQTVFPTGQPPRPGAQDASPSAETVPGLTSAIASSAHPGLTVCGGDLVSLVTAQGHLRGNAHTQYLVDTTCAGATGSSPDEVAVYDAQHGTIQRTAVLSQGLASEARTTAYPYTWKDHTVVLTYKGGTEYRLVKLTTGTDVVVGTLHAFH